MFIFLLTPFDTWYCYYLESNFCLVLLIKKSLLFHSLLNMKKWFSDISLFFCLFHTSLGKHFKKMLSKVGVQRKDRNVGLSIYRGWLSIKGGVQTYCTLWSTHNSYLKHAYKNNIVYFNKIKLLLSKSIQKIFPNDE